MKYHIWTVGCQMNKADSWRAADLLEAMGHTATRYVEDAGLVLLNTCVVRQSAEDKVYGRLSSLKPLKRHNPRAGIVVMGCLVDADSTALEQRFPFVDRFLPPSDVQGLTDFVTNKWGGGRQGVDETPSPVPVSSYVPAIQGCNNSCTYCIVRLRRGREHSRPVLEILDEVRCMAQRGAREVTLLGQNVDAYGHDLPGQPDLADLLRAVHEVDGLWRVRFLTSHPNDMSERIIQAVAELDKVCEHIELPVQAGHDLTLKRMARGYTVDQFRNLVQRIRERVPGVAIATDVIVGFPGETEDHFHATYNLLAEEKFDVVHVAAYSPRPGTAAARLDDDVASGEKDRRRRLIEELQRNIATEINHELLGSTTEVLVEEKHKGKWKGRTRTNKLVFFEDSGDWKGKLAQVKITWAGPWSMQGKLKLPHPA
ncbi:MAG: tRNA (N6-isopentenyl adenosine(37)-C2)-methylthiotransferase MiaB [Anaerolineae bacterium]|nr:tRNA (N6-isopentenyl adenosine(37)-C2)-methylthiotransferase MiaB [Anaerolineae bacterium]NIN93697.1 tRNA (N6-isopentenyl adenosine(37)-C2)-methylthiotransferase MiaB [Anaerolineae bacterium]NIQ76744.1 tRNA (N6-isopentenyl adenosine(37)-C2)-methylthiotransferase MiaB [Anaerolineae bacterium]